MFEFIFLMLLVLSEHIGAVILVLLGLLLIGTIAENIEIVCIVVGIISMIISSICYYCITNYKFDKGFIGVIIAIVAHIFFYLMMDLSGGLFFTYLVLSFCAVWAYSEYYDDSEILGILIALASIIIPTIIVLN